MAADIGLMIRRLLEFFDFSGKTALAVGAGGGQFIEYARPMRKVIAVDRDSSAMDQLRAAATRIGLQDRFEYWTGDFSDCDRRCDVVLFEFCLHEMDDPVAAVAKAMTLAPQVVIIDHAAGSQWAYFTGEEVKVDRSWRMLETLRIARRCSHGGEQRFGNYEELFAKVRSQGEESIKRIEPFRERANIIIPMMYTLALVSGPSFGGEV